MALSEFRKPSEAEQGWQARPERVIIWAVLVAAAISAPIGAVSGFLVGRSLR